MEKIGILASKQLRSILEGQVQLRMLSSTTHCVEEVQGHLGADVPITTSAQRQPNWKRDGQGHKAQQISSGFILKWCLFPTFEMLEEQLVWGEAAQQATLLPLLLLQEAKGKVPAG